MFYFYLKIFYLNVSETSFLWHKAGAQEKKVWILKSACYQVQKVQRWYIQWKVSLAAPSPATPIAPGEHRACWFLIHFGRRDLCICKRMCIPSLVILCVFTFIVAPCSEFCFLHNASWESFHRTCGDFTPTESCLESNQKPLNHSSKACSPK